MAAVSPVASSFLHNQLGSWSPWSQNSAQYAAATAAAIAATQAVTVPTLPLTLPVATTPLYPSMPCTTKPPEDSSPQPLPALLNQSKEPSQRLMQSLLPFNLPFAAPIVIQ